MRIHHFQSEEDLASFTEQLFHSLLEKKKRLLRGFFPTGRSAEIFYQLLQQKKSFWAGQFQVLQIDEFISPKRFFYEALKKSVLDPLQLTASTESIDPNLSESEFLAHIQKVISRPIDFALLGLGPNGHIGFHEPALKQNHFLGGKVKLSPESFTRVRNAPSEFAYTFGADSFLQAEKIILIITGADKRKIYEAFLSQEPNANLPATLLKNHPDFSVLTTFSA